MSKISPVLDLNKAPQLAEPYSLICAKNIKVLKDGSIAPDTGVLDIDIKEKIRTDCVRYITNRKAELNQEVEKYRAEIERIVQEDTNSRKQVVIDYVTNNDFILSDVVGTDTIEYMFDEENDFLILKDPGFAGDTSADCLLDKTTITTKEGLLNYINEIKGTSNDKLLFPISILPYYELYSKEYGYFDTSRYRALNQIVDNIGITGDYEDIINEIKIENNTFFNEHFIDIDLLYKQVEVDNSTKYYIDKYLLVYIYYFLFHHITRINELLELWERTHNISRDSDSFRNLYKLYNNKREEANKEIDSLNKLLEKLLQIDDYDIKGVISNNTCFYLFVYDKEFDISLILKYDELSKKLTPCNCNWNSSDGEITGVCNLTLKGDTILSFGEYANDNILIPFKSINLDKSSTLDNEYSYTQIPHINIINLSFSGYYSATISAGVYQFFIRYEISKNNYTSWIPASRCIFTASHKSINTVQGTLTYVDLSQNSSDGIVLRVDKAIYKEEYNYKRFQLGYLHSAEGQVVARSWNLFDIDTEYIYFDNAPDYMEEIEVTDLTSFTFGIYNVKNVANFKNKIYISNYIETNFNPDSLCEYAASVGYNIKGVRYGKSISYKNTHYCNYIESGNDFIIDKIGGSELSDLLANIINNDITAGFELVQNSDPISSEYDKARGLRYTLEYLQTKADYYIPTENINRALNSYEYKIEIFGYDITQGETANIPVVKEEFVIQGYFTDPYTSLINNIQYRTKYIKSFIKSDDNLNGSINVVDGNNNYKLSYILIYSNYHAFKLKYEVDIWKFKVLDNSLTNKTLIPYQHYNFYIHFVKNTGEITNGYKIGNTAEIDDYKKYDESGYHTEGTSYTNKRILYPTFAFTRALPDGYCACFISIYHVKNKVLDVIGNGKGTSNNYVDCLELDTLLEGALDNIPVKLNNTDYTGKYYPSSYPDNFETFGASGNLEIDSGDDNIHLSKDGAYVILPFEANINNILVTKLTPYIVPTIDNINYIYDNYIDLDTNGYLCSVTKPTANEYNTYISNTDFYQKTQVDGEGQDKYINLLPITSNDTRYSHKSTNVHEIYSNYNLDYLSLTITLYPKIVDIKKNDVEEDSSSSNSYDNNRYKLLTSVDSANLSSIYTLDSRFYNFTKKMYDIYRNDVKVKFDNTIRSSELYSDEEDVRIYKFNATDYYNCPTDKGIIINLKAAGNIMLVHTQSSMYRFTGNNSLSSNGGEEVSLQETDIFDTGITQLFGSELGFGGLRQKHHHVTSEDNYMFYDADSNNFYIIKNQGDFKCISDNIRKLLDHDNVVDVKFASDYYNDRVFVYVQFEDNTFVTLSYNIRTKSFVSLHDFVFKTSFNTKTRCYFIDSNNNIYVKSLIFESTDDFYSLAAYSNIYPAFTDIAISYSRPYIDVVIPNEYEQIKTLNYINWMSKQITKFVRDINVTGDDAIRAYNIAEEDIDKYLPYAIQIYTNETSTNIILLNPQTNIDTIDKINRVLYSNILEKDKPNYYCGKWSFNWFRNVLNTKGYNNSDNKSLIYGNYIVVRFIFDYDINFKFENLNINYSKEYEKAIY